MGGKERKGKKGKGSGLLTRQERTGGLGEDVAFKKGKGSGCFHGDSPFGFVENPGKINELGPDGRKRGSKAGLRGAVGHCRDQ